jgi:hypothetical protein
MLGASPQQGQESNSAPTADAISLGLEIASLAKECELAGIVENLSELASENSSGEESKATDAGDLIYSFYLERAFDPSVPDRGQALREHLHSAAAMLGLSTRRQLVIHRALCSKLYSAFIGWVLADKWSLSAQVCMALNAAPQVGERIC